MVTDFPRATPESAGIPSRVILDTLETLRDSRLCLHDLELYRDGKLLYEGYWRPMNREFMHRHYSCSKSFVSVAVGVAIGEGLLSLDDRVIDFFPDKAPENPHPFVAAVKIRDLLRMSTCFTNGSTYKPSDPDWADTWFREAPSHEPGRVFNYDTTATTMLCIIISRVTGHEFMEYLRPRVFDKIGFDPEHKSWCVETPCGHEWGGSGIVCTAYDFARFAMLCMNYGAWNGEQLVPEWYMREATSKQIDIQVSQTDRKNTGYGYQFWILPDGGFSFNGMGCQFAICDPKSGTLLVTHGYEELATVAKPMIFDEFNKILRHVGDPVPENASDAASLAGYTAAMDMATPSGGLMNASAAEKYSGKTFAFGENELGWRTARFDFGDDGGVLTYENVRGAHSLAFSFGAQSAQDFPETTYYDRRIGTPCGHGYLCYTSAAWAEIASDGGSSDALALWCQICGTHLAQLRMTFSFSGDSVTILARNHAEWFLGDYSGFATGYIKSGD